MDIHPTHSLKPELARGRLAVARAGELKTSQGSWARGLHSPTCRICLAEKLFVFCLTTTQSRLSSPRQHKQPDFRFTDCALSRTDSPIDVDRVSERPVQEKAWKNERLLVRADQTTAPRRGRSRTRMSIQGRHRTRRLTVSGLAGRVPGGFYTPGKESAATVFAKPSSRAGWTVECRIALGASDRH